MRVDATTDDGGTRPPPAVVFDRDRVTLWHGDCRDVLSGLPSESVDAVVTDPPYELKTTSSRGGFMGEEWDATGIAHDVGVWRECLRVLKPGGHLIAFSATRTAHRLVCAVEDAGFEIRDTLAWLYASGLSKSHDVSKAIDRAGGVPTEEQARALRERRAAAGLTREQVAEAIGCSAASVRDWEEGRARKAGGPLEWIVPSARYRAKLVELFGYTKDELVVVGTATDRRGDGTVTGLGHSGTLTAGGNTAAAAAWSGWGTSIKPAREDAVLARKPLVGTVAGNVQKYGTGALNVEACQVPFANAADEAEAKSKNQHGDFGSGPRHNSIYNPIKGDRENYAASGRLPSNVVIGCACESEPHDPECAVSLLNMQGEVTAAGGIARFYYCAKVPRSERREDDNDHVTVKPVALMRWLCKLVTPPNGVVFDPFVGSGSTLVAASQDGFRSIGVELKEKHVAIARRRLDESLRQGNLFARLLDDAGSQAGARE